MDVYKFNVYICVYSVSCLLHCYYQNIYLINQERLTSRKQYHIVHQYHTVSHYTI